MSPLASTIAQRASDEAFQAVMRQIDSEQRILSAEESLSILFRVGIHLTCDSIASTIATALGGEHPRSPGEIADEMITLAHELLEQNRQPIITLARTGARMSADAVPADEAVQ